MIGTDLAKGPVAPTRLAEEDETATGLEGAVPIGLGRLLNVADVGERESEASAEAAECKDAGLKGKSLSAFYDNKIF